MRGVRALRQAPLVVLCVLLATCRFEFKLIEPSIEVDAQAAYASGNTITLEYKFTADETLLRCKYAVDLAGSVVQQGVTGEFPPGTWQVLSITLDPDSPQGNYAVTLMAQAARGDDFVDLAFLTRTFNLFLDTAPPGEPIFSPEGGLFSEDVPVTLSHGEWDGSALAGSAVNIYYTTGPAGSTADPTASSTRYAEGTTIAVELDETPTVIRAIAIDDSGRKSAVVSKTFSFMNIEYMYSENLPREDNRFNTYDTLQSIYLHGYGLSNVTVVKFWDWKDTPATFSEPGERSPDGTGLWVGVMIPGGGSFAGDNTDIGNITDGTFQVWDTSGITAAVDEIKIDLYYQAP